MPTRNNYWSCTKFADWLRGTPKLSAGSGKEWNEWEQQSKQFNPIRFWLAEEALDNIQDFVNWPADKLYSFKYWINNRYITKTHALTSNLKRGEWHEFDTRLLYSMFDELVNFVEVEQAWWHVAWDSEARKKYNAPFYSCGWFRSRTWRSPEAGIEALEWASKLTDEEWLPEDQKHEAKPTLQATNAQELLDLYHWWKVIRPARPDPYDASGWTALCESNRKEQKTLFWEENTEGEREVSSKILDLLHEIEEQYDQEDEDMMIRVIKIRRGMWT